MKPLLFLPTWIPATVSVVVMSFMSASAQTYPVKPVRMILPFVGGTDLVGRMLAAKLSPLLGQQIVDAKIKVE